MPRQIDSVNSEIAGQLWDELAEVLELRSYRVEQHEGRPASRLQIAQAEAVMLCQSQP